MYDCKSYAVANIQILKPQINPLVSGILLGLFGCMDRNPLMKDTGFGPGLETKNVQNSKNSLFFYCLFQEPQSFSVFHDISASLSMSDLSSLQTTWLLSSDSFSFPYNFD